MNKKPLSLTVGITTCFGQESLLETVQSLRNSRDVKPFRFIIIADRTPIRATLKKELQKFGVELVENREETGQIPKQKQILRMCTTDLLLFTHDDVLFDPNALSTIVAWFEEHPQTTLASIRNQPLPAETLFERAVSVGTNLNNDIARHWNRGDNYLSLIGRCMAFRTSFLKERFSLPDRVVNSDAYCYLENKRKGGVYHFIPDVAVYFRNPQRIREFLRKSSRFQHSQLEMSRYFEDLSGEYRIPLSVRLLTALRTWFSDPVLFLLYLGIYGYSRILRIQPDLSLNVIWEADPSTKHI